ncbi:LiaF transmembrane domain-containing protein [Botryobacter ruber]|uniref:LiaF transmembrane domain-containing protein n=1 Tax=Botryobacter ruber TaxID=2171629 RepID=UPI000E0C84EC|nr:hypothetical protein [Botryobacter ruber]
MEKQDNKPEFDPNSGWERPGGNRSGRVLGGLLLIGIGVLLLAAKLDMLVLPSWVLSWQMFLIVLGLFLGFRHSFQRPGWLVLVLVGLVFLLSDYYQFNLKPYFWPIMIITLGLWLMLRPRKPYRFRRHHYREPVMPPPPAAAPTGFEDSSYAGTSSNTGASVDYAAQTSAEDYIDSTAVFGGIKKNIISKRFKGGEVVNVFGGTELNLAQADIEHPVVLDVTQIFGGTTLILPPHWQLKSEMVAILGGIDDRRPALAHGHDPNKVLILKGTTLLGGLNIKSY